MPRALISGVAGQDGSYLVDILLEKGYEVHGLYRHSSKVGLQNVQHNLTNPKFILHQGDVTDALCLDRIVHDVDPHEIYHEADQDNVDWSYKFPAYQMEITVKAVSNLLESVRRHCPSAKVFIPCSATMFGDAPAPQNENTPFNPRSPYACAKVAAYHIARMYRQNYGMFIVTGILYNHDSPRRNGNYLLHKICKAAATCTKIDIFDPDQQVGIGHAKDYMTTVHKLVSHHYPNDYIIFDAEIINIRSLCMAVANLSRYEMEDWVNFTVSSKYSFRSPTSIGSSMHLRRVVPSSPIPNVVDLLDELVCKYGSTQCV